PKPALSSSPRARVTLEPFGRWRRGGPSSYDRTVSSVGGLTAMRWVTVATEDGPRACGVDQGEYVDVNAADPELPASVRELLDLGTGWERQAWAALPRGVVRH